MALEIPSWLNTDFAERVLRLAAEDNTIQVIDVLMKPATSKGDNYTSDMMRVTIEFTRKQGDKKIDDKKSMIFKFEPMQIGARQDMIMRTQIFDTEIAMMTDTLKKMSTMLGCRLGASIFYVRMQRPLCLIMEDLSIEGFCMADRMAGLDLAHTMLAIQRLAKFHASSVALCEKEPKYKSVYYKGIFDESQPEEVSQFFSNSIQGLALEVEKWTELDKRFAVKIKNLVPVIYKKGIEASKRKDDEFNVINHGDCWVNNMMFRYDENSKPVEHIFVDFQLCVYTSPAVDLNYFLTTSPSDEVQSNNIEDLYEEYIRVLTTTMKKLGCKTLAPTMEQLKKSIREREMYAMISAMSVLPIVMIDKSQAQDLEQLINNGHNNPAYKNPIYRSIMVKKLQRYEKLGLLEP